ncbi:MAG: nucleotidyltransferase [Bacilli bacterium]|nr:nucleotidyltransferase [Bacilli bacterium]
MDLLILAAGMGSRFGGLKQIEKIDEEGNYIIDYSVFDAVRSGFDRVVFIIKEEIYDVFKETIGKRVEERIEVAYAFQKLDYLPEGYTLPEGREKPLGTAQAILCAKDVVGDSFIILNADDFYGKESFEVAANFLKSLPKDSKGKYANIAYRVANTMTENGSVKRGVLFADEQGVLEKLEESSIERKDGKIIATPLDPNHVPFEIQETTLVSMNMFAFTKDIMEHLDNNFKAFLDANQDNLMKCEYLIPTVVSDLVQDGLVGVDVLHTEATWYGVTYKEDRDSVVNAIQKMKEEGQYPDSLWNK